MDHKYTDFIHTEIGETATAPACVSSGMCIPPHNRAMFLCPPPRAIH